MVLAIGVPVANTMPPRRSRSHWVLRNMSEARWHSVGLGSPFTRSSLLTNGRFLKACASSTSLLGLGANMATLLAAAAPPCGVHVGDATGLEFEHVNTVGSVSLSEPSASIAVGATS